MALLHQRTPSHVERLFPRLSDQIIRFLNVKLLHRFGLVRTFRLMMEAACRSCTHITRHVAWQSFEVLLAKQRVLSRDKYVLVTFLVHLVKWVL